jgi:hypothetical protein
MMEDTLSFGEVLDDAERLTQEEQEELLEILSRRIAERRITGLARDVRSARAEWRKGECRPTNPDEIMAEVVA